MFNFSDKGVLGLMVNTCNINNNKFRYLDNVIIYHHYKIVNQNTVTCFKLRIKGSLFLLFYSKITRPLKTCYLYILNEFIFDRRFIYSILRVRSNKSRSRRTKRFIYQHFSSYFIGISAVNYQKSYVITTQATTACLLATAEYFNTIWFLFWNEDWLSAREKRLKVPSRGKKKFQKWLFNLKYIAKKKPITYIPKKLKRNKKKPIVLKNHFNVGFGYGYIGINYRFLLTRRGVI